MSISGAEFIWGHSILPCWLLLHAPSKDFPCPLNTDDSVYSEEFYWLLSFTLSFRNPQSSPCLILESHLPCKMLCCIRKFCFRHECVHHQTHFLRLGTRNTKCMGFSENEWINHFRHLSSPLQNLNLIYAVLFHHYSYPTLHSRKTHFLMLIPFLCPGSSTSMSPLISLCISPYSILTLHQPAHYETNPSYPDLQATASVSEIAVCF